MKRIYMIGIDGNRVEVNRMNEAAVKQCNGVLPMMNYAPIGEVFSLGDLAQVLQADGEGLLRPIDDSNGNNAA